MKSFILSALFVSAVATNVFVSPSGKKYHTHKDCQYLKQATEIKTISVKDAQSKGMTICARCKAKDNPTK